MNIANKIISAAKRMFSPQGRMTNRLIFSTIISKLTRPLGFTVVADHFYQPIPNRSDILGYDGKKRPLDSIVWELEKQADTAQEILSQYQDEFNGDAISRFGYKKDAYDMGSGDAEFLYAMVRAKKPQRIVEIGSGNSTLILASALEANQDDTTTTATLVTVDPYPANSVRAIETTPKHFDFQLLEQKVQDTDLATFEALERNDILFVDSSHVYKQGSDVEFEFLYIYPRLKAGVLVHIHDIFFPFDYPTEWNTKLNRFWNEQYFLEVFLQFNTKYEIFVSLSMLAYHKSSIFTENISIYQEDRTPGSFWMMAKS